MYAFLGCVLPRWCRSTERTRDSCAQPTVRALLTKGADARAVLAQSSAARTLDRCFLSAALMRGHSRTQTAVPFPFNSMSSHCGMLLGDAPTANARHVRPASPRRPRSVGNRTVVAATVVVHRCSPLLGSSAQLLPAPRDP